MKVYEAVLEQLWGAGVTHFSGMVGRRPRLCLRTRREPGALCRYSPRAGWRVALDATARLSGRPGVLMVHGGSGLLAAGLGVAAAALDGTPMSSARR